MRQALLAFACGALLAACAGAPVARAPAGEAVAPPVNEAPDTAGTSTAAPDLPLLRVQPAEFGATVQLNQHLHIRRGGERHEIDAVLAIDDASVRLAAVGFGLRLLTLSYDGHRVEERRHPALPAAVDGERILRDLVLTYWPLPALRSRLPQGWTLEEHGSTRELSWRGRAVVRIRYTGTDRRSGTIELQQLQHGYAIVIVSKEA